MDNLPSTGSWEPMPTGSITPTKDGFEIDGTDMPFFK